MATRAEITTKYARKYSYEAVKILQRVWVISGGQCGKHLHATMRILLDNEAREPAAFSDHDPARW